MNHNNAPSDQLVSAVLSKAGAVIARAVVIRLVRSPHCATWEDKKMRIFVSAIFVASSIAIGIAQGEPGAPQGQQPGAPQPGAQQPATPREQPAPKPQTTQTAQPGKMTIGGCIENAPAAAAGGGAPAGGAASAQAKFVLANAKPVGAAGAAVGTAGTTATRYQLEGEDKMISPHVNHQVEITGTVAPAAGGAAAGGAAAAPMFKVESVKMLA